MKRIKFITSLVIFYLMSCNYQNYFKAYKVSSPDGQKCLSFIGEYDDNGYIKKNRIYILGYEVDVLKKITKAPDTNYILMNFFGDLDGIDVKWKDNKIELYSSSKPLENKLSSSSEVVFIGRIPNAEIPTSHLVYCGYFFQQIHRNKYKSCKVTTR